MCAAVVFGSTPRIPTLSLEPRIHRCQIPVTLLAIVLERSMHRGQRASAQVGAAAGEGDVSSVSDCAEQPNDHTETPKPLQPCALAIVVDLNALRSLFAGLSRHRESSSADHYQYLRAVHT